MKTFRGKKVTVAGLAKSGMAAAFLLKSLGAKVWATDSGDSQKLREAKGLLEWKGIKVELGRHTPEFVEGKDLIVISPGVPEDSQVLKWAAEYKVPVIGEVELGYLCCKAAVVAVTGTNGKSTTTTLIGEILKKGGKRAVVCGNIGNPFCGEIAKVKKNSVVVLEVSSFQLGSIKTFRPHVAVMLNISQNHFDRHPDLRSYISAKARIFGNQEKGDWAVLNYDDPLVRKLKEKTKAKALLFSRKNKRTAAFFEDGSVFIGRGGKAQRICGASELKIKGTHNIENILACLCVASIFGISPKKIKEALVGFKGLEHRFEHVKTVGGVEFINDSKGTTVLATMMALESCVKPVILIAGGHDKGSDFRKARRVVGAKVKKLVLIGEAKEKIRDHLMGAAPYIFAETMEDAVKKSFGEAEEGDCVLLSPMCASFDMFRNFEERGRVFKEIIRALKEER
ncbi:MAG: UDP-N-acetylmuramoyl-L-alanine--D-glutamate ligase [Candidatus Omnitrophica bacterium]|nr:UDP-N-acetylmuramoyl-L-alanine--D-glutamate ligase [Candidatus Omnitrophota bacterium]MDD5310443.1 UDP-N-acetylmuramoyl-L-alanine--D-glutamate ligase [Candidatus Omnitrophota bacterium]MDD5546713.1 UDP-N-acetylmuramoyl-L-alanine--D-glutamate ligase [Candidatus Omnitrophota bacterium]